MKLTFFISRTKQIYEKTLTAPESKFKIKTLLTSAVICKQRLLHENEIVQYLLNYKYQDVKQSHFGKPLQASTKVLKNNYPKIAHIFLMGRSIFSYFLRLK